MAQHFEDRRRFALETELGRREGERRVKVRDEAMARLRVERRKHERRVAMRRALVDFQVTNWQAAYYAAREARGLEGDVK